MRHMEKITHLDELPYDKFIYVCDKIHKGEGYELSEKLDGENFSFGIQDGRFFTKSKTSPMVFDSSFYNNIEYMKQFKVAHYDIDQEVLLDIYSNHNVQFFCELLYTNQVNNIDYNKINVPALMPISFFIDEVEQYTLDHPMHVFISNLLPNFVILNKHIYKEKIKPDIQDKLEYFKLLYSDNLPILKSRKNKDKELKQLIRDQLNNLKDEIKEIILQNFHSSYFSHYTSYTPEGFIFKDSNITTKIVDKFKFTSENSENHSISTKLKHNKLSFKKEVIKKLFRNADILLNSTKLIQKLLENLSQIKSKELLEEKRIFEIVLPQLIFNELVSENNLVYHNQLEIIENYRLIKVKYSEEFYNIVLEWREMNKEDLSENIQTVIQSQINKQSVEFNFDVKSIFDIFEIIVNKNKMRDVLNLITLK